jgi:hypothetical protein
MRIKFNNKIYLCTKITHTPNSKLLLFTTSNGVYTVDMKTIENAQIYYEDVLIKGYCDVSKFEYSN